MLTKFVESFDRAEHGNLMCKVPNSFGQTLKVFLYPNHWKQTVSSIVSKIPVCYKHVFLSIVQGIDLL